MMQSFKLLAAIVLFAGCAASAPGAGRPGVGDRSILTSDEIVTSTGRNVYEVIAQLRPEYLRSRGAGSLRNEAPPRATVYVDNVRFGALETLQSLTVDHLLRVEYLSASDATTRFGTDHTGGAILVTTR